MKICHNRRKQAIRPALVNIKTICFSSCAHGDLLNSRRYLRTCQSSNRSRFRLARIRSHLHCRSINSNMFFSTLESGELLLACLALYVKLGAVCGSENVTEMTTVLVAKNRNSIITMRDIRRNNVWYTSMASQWFPLVVLGWHRLEPAAWTRPQYARAITCVWYALSFGKRKLQQSRQAAHQHIGVMAAFCLSTIVTVMQYIEQRINV